MNDLLTQHRTQQSLLSIDPGKQTGIALGIYGDDEPYKLAEVWQVSGGLKGFIDWWREHETLMPTYLVCEKFVLRNNAFVADTEPLLIEGALRVLWGGDIVWQLRTDKMFVTDQLLKEHGLWKTGKALGWKDCRDANDAIIHGLAFLRKQKHLPTLRKFWGNNA